MKAKEAAAFILLGLLWGSSFLWIRIAVQDVGPFTLVALRLLFGLAGLAAVMAFKRQRLPTDRTTIRALAVMAISNIALPFTLISWGEISVDSSMASILNGTVPLFSIIIAHFWLHDERITVARFFGLIIGFVGVVILVGRNGGAEHFDGSIWGHLAILAASISYAFSASYARRNLRGQPPLVQSTTAVLIADVLLWLSLPVVTAVEPSLDAPNRFPTQFLTWFAIAWLGLLGSCVAFLLFFYLLNTLGATRTTLVTYVFPVVGIILGIVFLNEPADWRLGLGSLLVISGIIVVNIKAQARPSPGTGRGQT